MREVLMTVPDSLLAERARLDLDVRDEMWEGVLRMAPEPETEHQLIGVRLLVVLLAAAERLGLQAFYELVVIRADDDYRVPDLVVVALDQVTKRGITGSPTFAVEVRSPGDDSYRKTRFYAAVSTHEYLIVDRDTKQVELFVQRDGELVPVEPDGDGWLRSAALGLSFRTTADARLEVDDGGARTLLP